MIRVDIIPVLTDNYTFVIIAPDQTCAILDPGEAAPVISYLEQHNLKPSFILNTHHHYDHVDGNIELKTKYKALVIAPKKEALFIPAVDKTLKAGDVWNFAGEDVSILMAEGHTAGGIMFHFTHSKKLFTGDTLFSMGCGRLFEGTAEHMFASLQQINALPEETEIYCGHEYTLNNGAYCAKIEPDNTDISTRISQATDLRAKGLPTIPSTVGLEKKTNVFLRAKTIAEHATLRGQRNKF